MDVNPFRKSGSGLLLGAVAGYAAFLAAWLIIAGFGSNEELASGFAQGFALMVLPPLLLIPVGLSTVTALLAMRSQGFTNETEVIRMGGMFAAVFSVAAGAAFLGFFLNTSTALAFQPHVLATMVFCLALGVGDLFLVMQAGRYEVPGPTLQDELNSASRT